MTFRKDWEDRKVKRYIRFSFPPYMFGSKNGKIKEQKINIYFLYLVAKKNKKEFNSKGYAR